MASASLATQVSLHVQVTPFEKRSREAIVDQHGFERINLVVVQDVPRMQVSPGESVEVLVEAKHRLRGAVIACT